MKVGFVQILQPMYLQEILRRPYNSSFQILFPDRYVRELDNAPNRPEGNEQRGRIEVANHRTGRWTKLKAEDEYKLEPSEVDAIEPALGGPSRPPNQNR